MTATKHKRKSRWGWLRPTNINVKIKIIITLVMVFAYILAFPSIFKATGGAGSALVIFPVGIIAWLWGLWGGLIAGMLVMPLNLVLFELVGESLTLRSSISGVITVVVLGSVIGWLSTLLGQIYQQSQELEIAHDQALEANRLKTVMLSKVSHELRTPLSAILGYAELLKEGVYGDVNEKQGIKLSSIIESSNELEVLVSDLLDMSRIESGNFRFFHKPFAVADLAENVLSKTAVSTKEKSLQISYTVAPDMPTMVIGDQVRVTQILSNLVTNAIKYTDEGSIQIVITPEKENQWRMKVSDTGIGIAPEALDYIFDSFRQEQPTAADTRSGIGLGLSIVNELVTLMNGIITVKSTVGQGSVFSIILPLDLRTTETTS